MKIRHTLLALAIAATPYSVSYAQSLNTVIAEAVLSNPQVQSVMNARNAVFEEVKQASAGYLPTIDIGAGVGYEKTKNFPGDDTELKRSEANLSLNQMLFDGFRTSSEVSRQSARLDSINHRLREISEETALEAARAYLEVLKRESLVEQAKNTLLTHVRIFDQIKRRSESGVGTIASIKQAEGRLALAEVNVLSAENNLLDAGSSFERVTGKKAGDTLEDPDIQESWIPATFAQALERAYDKHPTLKLAASDVQAARSQYEAARSLMFPTLNLEVNRTWNNNIDGNEGRNEDLTAMIRMRYNLYNGGADKARVRQTRHQIDEARNIQTDAARQALQSLDLSWNAYEILGRQLDFLEQHVTSTESTRDAYLKQFNIGQRSLLDLLDTENEVFSSQNAFNEAIYDHMLAQYRLLSGTGELLDVLELDLTSLQETSFVRNVVEASPTLMERLKGLNPF
ncbi:MAG: TolC family outer membrane protein [Oceanospirillaceae bacterium]|nr:TolC family outer membrane protein [Oceanospirillaceae bacterium]